MPVLTHDGVDRKHNSGQKSGTKPGAPPTDAAVTPAALASDATKVLAKFVLNTSYVDLPAELGAHLRVMFLDMVGNSAFAGLRVESSPGYRAAIRKFDPNGGTATVIGDSRTYAWHYAALLNGAHAHSLDDDDTSIAMTGHPGASVLATAIAESERLDVHGRAFLEALAVGYEVECRLGEALTMAAYSRGFHVTGVVGGFGSLAVIAKLRSWSEDVLENAWGLQLSKAAGSMQYLANGSWNKRLHPGFAAHDALLCAAFAEEGVIGASAAFEGEYGLLHAYSPAPKVELLTQGLGKDWVTLSVGIKPYPSCRLTHTTIDAAIKLREQVSAADRPKASFVVEIPAESQQIVGGTEPFKSAPRSTVDAQFSDYFQLAAAWVDGNVNWDSYDKIHDPTLLALMKRTVLKTNNTLKSGAAILTVTVNGKTITDQADVPLGEPSHWMGDASLKKKFMYQATTVFGVERATEIEQRIWDMDEDTSLKSIISLLQTHEVV